MTAASFFRDITAFSVQIAVVGLGLAVLLKLVKIPAGVRFFGLRLALVASLVVPWLLRAPEVQAPALATAATPAASLVPLPASGAPTVPEQRAIAAGPSKPPAIPWTHVGFGALLIGIAARIVWLSMGVLRLFRLQRGSVVVDAPEYSALQQQLGTRATIAEVPALSQPATFGVRRPVVLLPEALAGAPASLRRAVVTHELFHVRRRDWLSALVEEMVRTALWFHPAILWMTSQIQLAREEIVDELTVRATGDRRTYVEALLAFADTPGLSPAPAFAQRRQLFQRILSVSKERVMSRSRIVSSAVVLVAAVSAASWYASTVFPILKAAPVDYPRLPTEPPREPRLHATDAVTVTASRPPGFQRSAATAAPQEPKAVTPENPIPRRTRGVAPVRPSRFADAVVVISPLVTVDRNGTVMSVAHDACAVSGASNSSREDVCDAFFEPTAAAIRQWRYERPVQGPIQFYVHVRYQPGAAPTITQSAESYKAWARDAQDSERARADEKQAVEEFLREQERDLKERAAELIARSRELERAQRLSERGLLAESERARLQAELARAEAQIQNDRPQRSDEQARIAAQLAAEQLRAAQRQLEATRARQSSDERARAEEERRLLEGKLHEIERQLAEAALSFDRQASTTTVNPTPTTPFDGSPQLKSPSGRAPIRVGSIPGMKPPVPTKRVKTEYSADAKQARVEGTVSVEVLVDERGHVAEARVLKSIPLLDKSALDAAKQWEFTPTLMNGEPVPVLLMLEMHFTLK